MSNLNNYINNGFRWLTAKQRVLTSVPVVYVSGTNRYQARATIGRPSQDVLSQLEANMNSLYFDFLIESCYLPIAPKAGDKIICDNNEYEVVSQFDGRCFITTDSTFEMLRIHTQLL